MNMHIFNAAVTDCRILVFLWPYVLNVKLIQWFRNEGKWEKMQFITYQTYQGCFVLMMLTLSVFSYLNVIVISTVFNSLSIAIYKWETKKEEGEKTF